MESRPSRSRRLPYPRAEECAPGRAGASRLALLRAAAIAGLAALLLLAAPARAHAQYVPPDADWRVLETPNFRVTFTPELEPLARRAASRAEEAHALLSDVFLPPPRGRIDLIVADNIDSANGLASPLPRNRIVLYATPPAAVPALAYFDDWLHLLVLHELVHIFHLDHARGLPAFGRTILGRHPALFPHALTTGWLIEGLATYFESEYTEGGRVSGSYGDMILRTAVLEDAFFSIDRASLDPIAWPAGTTRYIYGGFFLDHLARRHGPEKLEAFLDEIAGSVVPYRLDSAARSAFGVSLRAEWRAWEAALRERYDAVAADIRRQGLTEPELLTTAGRYAHHPRFTPAGDAILFMESTGRRDAALRLLEGEGQNSFVVRRSSFGRVSWLPDGAILYADADYHGPYRIYSDLVVKARGEAPRRVTSAARLTEPDAHPDGRRAIAVASASGTNVLAIVDLQTGEQRALTEPDLDRLWAAPRWSPDGETLAAVRRVTGELPQVVLLDQEGRTVREITAGGSVASEPAWSPDGRYLLFSSDRGGISNLHAYDLQTGRLWQVTNVLGGAFEPDVSPDGAWIAFSHYRADGYHIARIPFDPDPWIEVEIAQNGPVSAAAERAAEGEVRSYSAWPSVLPTAWLPLLIVDEGELGLGAAVAGQDLVERHIWAADVTAFTADVRIDAGLNYRYQGLGTPSLNFLVEQRWEVLSAAVTGVAERQTLLRRERHVAGSLSFLRPGWRTTMRFDLGVDVRDREMRWREPPAGEVEPWSDTGLDAGTSAAFAISTARAFALSLGAQEGATFGTRLEARRYLDGPGSASEESGYWRSTARATLFEGLELGGPAPWVVAVRVDGGLESNAGGRGFGVGGAGAAATIPSLTPRRTATLPVRGFPAGTQRGSRAAAGSFEVRFPVTMVERGYGLLPLALRRLSGGGFADVGSAWCPEGCGPSSPERPDPLVGAGLEAIVELRVGYHLDLPLRFGVAFPLRGPATSPTFHLRTGYAF